jgi:hypothetical protein
MHVSWRPITLLLGTFTLLFNLLGCASTLPPQPPQPPSSIQLATLETDQTVALEEVYGNGNASLCTGVWVSPDLILTAAHCVDGAITRHNKAIIEKNQQKTILPHLLIPPMTQKTLDMTYFTHREEPPAGTEPVNMHHSHIVYYHSAHDLVILRATGFIPLHSFATMPQHFPPVGEKIRAMVHPIGLYWTYLEGTLSAYRPGIARGADDEVKNEGPYLQIEMPVIHGASGGGVFDSNGHLIGIISFVSGEYPGVAFCAHPRSVREALQAEGLIPLAQTITHTVK